MQKNIAQIRVHKRRSIVCTVNAGYSVDISSDFANNRVSFRLCV